jgi:zinc protease
VSNHGSADAPFHRFLDPAAAPVHIPIVRFPVTRLIRFSALTLLTIAPVLGFAQDAPKPKPLTPIAKSTNAINIKYEKYTLPNGLTVILSQDKSAPTVAVDVAYHVGSKNEVAGRTGFAHLFEHVMFTGSGHVPYGLHDKFTEGVGGNNNGGTSYDETSYYENIPSNYVEHALWMESDRMGWLLDALDTAKYNAQRSIVQQERKERVDNVPFGTAREIMLANMYPTTNPYNWDVIGHLSDLQAAPVDAVKDFFRQYYVPNNATVAIVGDFDPATTKTLVKKYFGDISRGKPIPRPKVAPVTLTAEKRLTFEDKAVTSSPRLFITWPTVSVRSDDQYALDVLQSVLFGSRTARLTKELVYDRQLAASVGGGQNTMEDAGQFGITVTPRPNASLTQLEVITDSVIDKLKREGPTADEIARAKAGAELSFISGLESNLGKANALASDQAFFDNPGHSFTVDYPKSQAVTAADVKRVANRYLTAGRIVLSVVPVGQTDKASKPEQSKVITGATGGSH